MRTGWQGCFHGALVQRGLTAAVLGIVAVFGGAACGGSASNNADSDNAEVPSKPANADADGTGGMSNGEEPVPTEPSNSNGCKVNSDCVGSAAERDAEMVRCFPKELYCLEGECVSACPELCEVVRSDVNPCEPPAICAPVIDEVQACTMKPIPCQSEQDCPRFSPPGEDGSEASWSCEKQVCRHPAVSYPTQ